MKKISGLTNKYSASLLAITALLILTGGILIFHQYYWGFVPFLLGMIMLQGFKELSASNPRQMGLITFFGKRTKVKVEGLTFLLDWFYIEIVGVAIFDMPQADKEYKIENIRCCDGVRMEGTLSVSTYADENNLDKFDDAKRMEGVQSQLGDLSIPWIQKIASNPKALDGSKNDYKWMESHSKEISDKLRDELENGQGNLVDLENLGVKIKKLALKLKPISKKITDADEDYVAEMLKRRAEEQDTETVNRQVAIRYKMYLDEWTTNGKSGQRPTLERCRKEVFNERLAKAGKFNKNVNKGGVNVIQQP